MTGLAVRLTKVSRFILFFPISVLWAFILRIRHFLFDLGWLSSYRPAIPSLGIGNLELGGSGKTPMADYLIQVLKNKEKIAYLSRGYGRSTRGFLEALPDMDPNLCGDEVAFLVRKHRGTLRAFVCENRAEGIRKIAARFPEVSLILLDDVMQHRWVRPHKMLLLSPFNRPFFKNFLFPSGTLRDLRSSWKRSDALVFTKAHSLAPESRETLLNSWNEAGAKPVFLSKIVYGQAQNHRGHTLSQTKEVVCLAGLADNSLFFSHCQSHFSPQYFISKPDHYRYLAGFFEKEGLKGKTILTTEKDIYKLLPIAPDPDLLYFLPIETEVFPTGEFLDWLEK